MLSLLSSASKSNDRKAKRTPRGSASGPTLSVIAAGMRLEGQIASSGAVRIEGTIVGNVHCESQVIVAKGGSVEGDIHAPEVITAGEVKGAILAGDRAELLPSSVVTGDITTNQLMVQEGSQVNGRLRTGKQRTTQHQGVEERLKTHVEEPQHSSVSVTGSGSLLGNRRSS